MKRFFLLAVALLSAQMGELAASEAKSQDFLGHSEFVKELKDLESSKLLSFEPEISYHYPDLPCDSPFLDKFGLTKEKQKLLMDSHTHGYYDYLFLQGDGHALKWRRFKNSDQLTLKLILPLASKFEPPAGFRARHFTFRVMDKLKNEKLGLIELSEELGKAGKEVLLRQVQILERFRGRVLRSVP